MIVRHNGNQKEQDMTLLYLLYAPIAGSQTTDTLVTIGVASVGAVVGAVLQRRLENSIGSRRSKATIMRSISRFELVYMRERW